MKVRLIYQRTYDDKIEFLPCETRDMALACAFGDIASAHVTAQAIYTPGGRLLHDQADILALQKLYEPVEPPPLGASAGETVRTEEHLG